MTIKETQKLTNRLTKKLGILWQKEYWELVEKGKSLDDALLEVYNKYFSKNG